MPPKQRLELTWIGKDQQPRLEPRILIEDPEKSYGDFYGENKLIFGDNLLALKALEQDYAGKIKCIFIDPPYNTGQAFENYPDELEHSIWLGLMRERLEILRSLLKSDGTIFCQLNDDEMAYAKVLMDEVFGRQNFLNTISVKMKQTAGASGGGEDKKLKKNIEYILIYAKDSNVFQKFNDVLEEEDLFELIQEMKDAGKSWKYTRVLFNHEEREYVREIKDGSGNPIRLYKHYKIKIKSISEIVNEEGISEQEAYFKYFNRIFRDTNAQSSIRTRVIESSKDLTEFVSIDYIPNSGRSKGKLITVLYKGNNRDQIAWLRDVACNKNGRLIKLEKVGTYWDGFPLNNLTKEGGVRFPNGKKPEALISRVIELATNPGDIVLDSFAGSGTTGAVAHKMGRQWIMVELREHCHTHIIPRMQKVIDGTDQGGISQAVGWQGGGGFKYYLLAPSLLKKDHYGNWVIDEAYNADMLAAAMAKHEGFRYQPDPDVYWKQGRSTEKDFIFTTTNFITVAFLDKLHEEMQPDESLLICCKAFSAECEDRYPTITLKKIPKMLLGRCEFGRDDYSLNVINLPPTQQAEAQQDADDDDDAWDTAVPARSKQLSLMGESPRG